MSPRSNGVMKLLPVASEDLMGNGVGTLLEQNDLVACRLDVATTQQTLERLRSEHQGFGMLREQVEKTILSREKPSIPSHHRDHVLSLTARATPAQMGRSDRPRRTREMKPASYDATMFLSCGK